MKDHLLIITNRSDYTADLVIKRLHERKRRFIRFNTEDFPLASRISVRVALEEEDLRILHNRWNLSQEDIKSVWFRRPVLPNFQDQNLSQADQEFALRENGEFTQGVWRLLDQSLWITAPDLLRKVETKALQLRRATQLGFLIPDTLISNNAEEIKLFYREYRGKVVVKPISHGGYGESGDAAIFTHRLGTDFDESLFDMSSYSPFVIQQEVEKEFDVRLTAFGDRLFAHSIKPKIPTSKLLDWRRLNPQDLIYTGIDIPLHVMTFVKQFMDSFGILFGAFDFSLRKDGAWVFLEINPNGQWAWLELSTGAPMSDALINLLCN